MVQREPGVVVHRDALARGEAVLLQHDAAPGGTELRHVGASRRFLAAAKARPRAMRTPAASATSRQNAFEVSIRAAVAGRPEHADAGVRQRVRDARGERRLRPDHDELRGDRARGRDDGTGVERVDGGQAAHPVLVAIAALPGATKTSFMPGSRGELPGERVLARARADDEGAGRRRCARRAVRARDRARGRRRIGRQARSIVWVRSGPTETSTIGTPASSSTALT